MIVYERFRAILVSCVGSLPSVWRNRGGYSHVLHDEKPCLSWTRLGRWSGHGQKKCSKNNPQFMACYYTLKYSRACISIKWNSTSSGSSSEYTCHKQKTSIISLHKLSDRPSGIFSLKLETWAYHLQCVMCSFKVMFWRHSTLKAVVGSFPLGFSQSESKS